MYCINMQLVKIETERGCLVEIIFQGGSRIDQMVRMEGLFLPTLQFSGWKKEDKYSLSDSFVKESPRAG